ncbi:MAG: PKD domain-containing protein, partial [Bradymonadia bacterium]
MTKNSRRSRIQWACFVALLATGLGATTASALSVVTVPQSPQDTTIPHGAINNEPTRFMAIARDGAAPYTVSWDYDGNGTWDTTFNTNDPYNLAADYTYPVQASDNLFVANVRVVDGGGNTAFGSFPVLVYANVPRLSQANSATEEQLNVMRNRAITRGLWWLHVNYFAGRAGSGSAISGYMDKRDGLRAGSYATVDYALTGAYLWALALNGHFPAYEPGTYAGPSTPDWVAQNNALWNNTPFAEDAIRMVNWGLNTFNFVNIPAADEADDGNPAIAGTNDGIGFAWTTTRYGTYSMPHLLGGFAAATKVLVGTNTQTGNATYVSGRTWPYIMQQIVDWAVFAQMDGGQDVNGAGAWLYTANPGTSASNADGSTTQWMMIGLEAAKRKFEDEGVYLNNMLIGRIANQLRFGQDSISGGVKYRNSATWADGWSGGYGRLNLTGGGVVGSGLLNWNDTTQFNCDGSNGVVTTNQPYLGYTSLTRCDAHNIYTRYYNYLTTYYNSHWNDGNYNTNTVTAGRMYAIYSTQKGARSLIPELPAYGARDWYREFSVYLVKSQYSAGQWVSNDGYISQNYTATDLNTAYGVLILTPSLFNPKPEAVGQANPATVVEGCTGAGAGEVTVSHADSFHPDPENQIAAYQWDVDNSDGVWWDTGAAPDFETADRNQSFTHTYTTRGTYTLTLRVVDEAQPEAGTDIANFTVTVEAGENLAPSANANGAYVINDGDDLTLNGSGSDPNTNCGDSISAAWDLDGDGAFDDAIGLTPTVGAGALSGLARSQALPITLRVTDSAGASTDSSTTLTIFNNRPLACFNVNPNRGSCGQAITLDAGCTTHLAPDGQIVGYSWDLNNDGTFGDSTDVSTQITPNAFGDITVTLRVTDSEGTTDDETIVIPVDQGNSPPTANANGPYQVLLNSSVTLSAAGSSDPDGACGDSIVSYSWDLDGNGVFGDAVGASPEVTGAALQGLGLGVASPTSGQPRHEIRVRVTDSLGVSNEDTAVLVLYGSAPVAVGLQDPQVGAILIEQFDPNIAGVAIVLLDGTRSYHEDPNKGIVQWAWDVDDDGSVDANGSSANIPVFFPEMPDGETTRTIRLTVTDNTGTQATTTFQAAYKPPPTPPSTDADPDDDLPEDGYTINLGDGVTFDGSNTTDPDVAEFNDYVKTMEWDIDGDGTYDYSFTRNDAFDNLDMTVALTAQDLANYGIDSPGDYVVTLRARDSIGLSATDTTTLTVLGVAPVAIISADGGQAACGAPVDFSASESYHENPNRNIISYSWDFDGDGNEDSDQVSDTFQFPAFGDYTASLTVTDDFGTQATETFEISVTGGNQPPVAGTNGPFVINVGQTLSVSGASSVDPNTDCGDAIVRYNWDFDNDGFYDLSTVNANGSIDYNTLTNTANVLVANPSTGEPKNTVTLTVEDGQGAVDTISTTLTIYGTDPVASANVDQGVVGCQSPVTFSPAGTYHQDPRRSIVSYQWDIDYDGNFQVDFNAESPSFTFTAPGAHTVALRVTDDQGRTDIDLVTVDLSIQNVAPTADAGGPYQTAIVNGAAVPVDIDASASFDANAPCDRIVSYEWDFNGDGVFDDANGAIVEGYTNPNWAPGLSQVVKVRITDESGATAESQAQIQVQAEPPPSVEALTPEAGLRICAATTATFNVSDPEGDVVTVIARIGNDELGRVDVDTPDDGSSVGGSINFNPGDFEDGDYLVTFTARDAGGGEDQDVTGGTFAITCDSDADGDLVPDVEDNCPNDANLDQADTDGDGLGDACDACIFDADNDVDGDGICGDVDNCPRHANPDQVDANGDGFGDVCIDPTADLGDRGNIGDGVGVGAGSDVGNDAIIGNNVDIGDNVDFGNAVDL